MKMKNNNMNYLNNYDNYVPVISFLSGKGGVGKTSLAVNFCHFLSEEFKIVLIDFDIFNRGSTALLFDKELQEKYWQKYFQTSYELLQTNSDELSEKITNESIIKINDNFLFVPATKTRQLIDWEILDEKNIAKFLENYILLLIKEYKVKAVVIDARAGPDPTTMGVSTVSDFPIIVTEADPITMNGTYNFRDYINSRVKKFSHINFIVNKIPKKYNIRDIDKIQGYLRDIQFLQNIPFEYNVFESFGTKSILKTLPNSFFTQKIISLPSLLFKNTKFKNLIPEKTKQKTEKEIDFISKEIRPIILETILSKPRMIKIIAIMLLFTGIIQGMFYSEYLRYYLYTLLSENPFPLFVLLNIIIGILLYFWAIRIEK